MVYADIIVKGKTVKTRLPVENGDMTRLLRALFYNENISDADYVVYRDWEEEAANADASNPEDACGGGQKDRRRLPQSRS